MIILEKNIKSTGQQIKNTICDSDVIKQTQVYNLGLDQVNNLISYQLWITIWNNIYDTNNTKRY